MLGHGGDLAPRGGRSPLNGPLQNQYVMPAGRTPPPSRTVCFSFAAKAKCIRAAALFPQPGCMKCPPWIVVEPRRSSGMAARNFAGTTCSQCLLLECARMSVSLDASSIYQASARGGACTTLVHSIHSQHPIGIRASLTSVTGHPIERRGIYSSA